MNKNDIDILDKRLDALAVIPKHINILEILFLNETKYSFFVYNINLYQKQRRRIELVENMNNDLWIKLFSQDTEDFLISIQRIQSLELSINEGMLKEIILKVKTDSYSSTNECIEDMFMQKEIMNRLSALSKQKNSVKACVSDCGTCKREKCILYEV